MTRKLLILQCLFVLIAASVQVPSARTIENGNQDSVPLVDTTSQSQDTQAIRERLATHIVKGTIANVASFWEKGSIYSIAEMAPEMWLKGTPSPEPLFLKYEGGRVGGVQLTIIPGPIVRRGEESTVFLRHLEGNEFRLIWSDQTTNSLQASTTSFEPGGIGYEYSGMFWGSPEVFTPDFNRGTVDIPSNQEWDAVRTAFDTWNGAGAALNLIMGQSGDCFPRSYDYVNCLAWMPGTFANFQNPYAVAETSVWTCLLGDKEVCLGEPSIDEVDIRFNENSTWSLNPSQDFELDVQGVATHEIGHSLFLLDIYGSEDDLQTMFGDVTRPVHPLPPSKSSLIQRSLFWGDVAGARYIYPRQYDVSPGQWIGDTTEGGDVAIADLNGDRYPELFFGWVDGPGGANKIYYRIGWNLNGATGVVSWWQNGQFEKPGWVGDSTSGLGLAIADINRNLLKDLVIAWVDNPSGDNRVHYQIGWDLRPDGSVGSWSGVIAATGGIGWETRGLGIAVEDINGNGNLDLVFSWVDDAAFGNNVVYSVRYDVQPGGQSSSSSGGTLISGIEANTQGHGLAFNDFNKDGVRDVVAVWSEVACIDSFCVNILKYRVGWSVSASGTPSSWTSNRFIPGQGMPGLPIGALGVFAQDLNENGRTDMVFLWKRGGSSSAKYVVDWDAALQSITAKQNDAGLTGDAGNSWADASRASTGVGYLIGQDGLGDVEDWYRFPVTSGNAIVATVTVPVAADFDLTLYDSDGFWRAAHSNRGNLDETIQFQADKSGDWRIRINVYDPNLSSPSIGIYSFQVVTGACCGGSVAYGTLITMRDGMRVPVQNLKVGDQMLGYDTEISQFTVATVTSLTVVNTSNMLVIDTEAGMPLRVDANPAQTLWTKKIDGSIGWLPVTELQVGDFLFEQERGWVMVTRIEFAARGLHVMFDIISTAPYFANGYLDPQEKV